MRFPLISALVVTALAGCTLPQADAPRVAGAGCTGPGETTCRFTGAPARTETAPVRVDRSDAVLYPLAEELRFVDSRGETWVAPRGTLTDGSAVPPLFTPIVGSVHGPAFATAAALHDAVGGRGNAQGAQYRSRSWQATHRMYYDALRAGGVPEETAKVLYAALYLKGEQWGLRGGARYDPRVRNVPDREMEAAMRQAKAFVEGSNPSMARLEAYLQAKQRAMFDRLDGGRDDSDFIRLRSRG